MGLAQAEKGQKEENDHDEADKIDDAVHFGLPGISVSTETTRGCDLRSPSRHIIAIAHPARAVIDCVVVIIALSSSM